MPMYEYRCNKCGEIFEELVSSDDEKVPCPKCGSTETEKLLSACASHTKGGAVSTTSVTSANGSRMLRRQLRLLRRLRSLGGLTACPNSSSPPAEASLPSGRPGMSVTALWPWNRALK